MRIIRSLLLFSCILAGISCRTYISANGKKYRQMFPAKDKHRLNDDTMSYVTTSFLLSDYLNRRAFVNGKKLIQRLSPHSLKDIAATNSRYVVYFLNPDCSHPSSKINWLDSLSKKGNNVIVVSLYNDYRAIDNVLRPTSFAGMPYYIIENESDTRVVLDRQRDLIKSAFPECYKSYKDGIINAEYYIIADGTIMLVR